ncbi:MAG: sigma-70 family RNA polymerase sigma factor [Planctomycetes bacterium]|nr:sigma-70 family RNA polymerase sigma factor [Planctomycetota bacterium]
MDSLRGTKRQRSERDTKARFEIHALPHLDAVYRMALTMASNESEAEDLAQETFARAFAAFDRFELRKFGAKPWLLRILYNTSCTARGKRRREPTLLDDVDFDHFADELDSEPPPTSVDEINWEHFDEEVKLAVAQLSPEYRTVLLLWAIERLTYREIAEVCECAMGTVMSRLYRARRLLGRQLGEYARDRKLSTERFE